ncbi:hypothetical protein [Clostridium chrysemydis]|nr:hypothetical protein [Clostridium chrysemydis]
MIILKKDDFLKDAPDYEDYTDNVANLSKEEKESLGIKSCNCSCKNKK